MSLKKELSLRGPKERATDTVRKNRLVKEANWMMSVPWSHDKNRGWTVECLVNERSESAASRYNSRENRSVRYTSRKSKVVPLIKRWQSGRGCLVLQSWPDILSGRWGFTGAGNEERTCTMPARTTTSKDRTQPEARGTSSARYSKEENHRSILHFYTKRATTTTNVSALFRPDGVFWFGARK